MVVGQKKYLTQEVKACIISVEFSARVSALSSIPYKRMLVLPKGASQFLLKKEKTYECY